MIIRAIILCGIFLSCSLLAVPYPKHRRPADPFVSGDTLRAFCDFAFDELTSLDPAAVTPGSTVFISGEMIQEYFEKIHPWINAEYILISHNSDISVPGPYAVFLEDQKLIGWFTQNLDATVHPKLHPLPIGIENYHWKPENTKVLPYTKRLRLPKVYLLYSNFNVDTFPAERKEVEALVSYAPFCYRSERKKYEDFIRDIAASKFVLCPRGNGLDTHRLWESLYVGSIPIVKSSSLDALYAGLPIVIVQEWSEVTEEFLHRKYEEMKKGSFSLDKLEIRFWLDGIKRLSMQYMDGN